jgi:hypothetical protein
MKNAIFITGGVVLSAILWNMYQKKNGKNFMGKPLATPAAPVSGAKPIETVLVEKTGVDGLRDFFSSTYFFICVFTLSLGSGLITLSCCLG